MPRPPRPRASTTARGYGAEHQRQRDALAPSVARGERTCWRCGQPILPGQAWDLGHDDLDRSVTRGPEHRHRTPTCPGNRSAGATLGNRARGKSSASNPNPPRVRPALILDDW